MNKRVQAYTIMEVTIAMLLAAIVIAITYTVYTIGVKSYGSYTVKNSNMATLIRLDELLQKDFEKAEAINKTGTGISCANDGRVVSYEFIPEGVIRSSGITDTFKVNVETINLLFEHVPVTELALSGEESRVDELRLDLLFEENRISNSYHKHYSSANLIQRNNDALN